MNSDIEGFEVSTIHNGSVALSVHTAGNGPPLVLLHGYPQNHMCWERVAGEFAKFFHVIIPDLRGYGDSDAPADDLVHSVYSKRTMATDVTAILDSMGYDQAFVLGHDRGARVAYRLALDAPERITKLGIIEIVPTGDLWASWNAELAMKAYHWTFLAQPSPLPERMISADPTAYIDWTLKNWTLNNSLDVFSPAALERYRAQACEPERVAAMCADYRAGATFDRELDQQDRALQRRITAPVHFLWAKGGFPAAAGDPAKIWADWTIQLTDTSCESGHFAMEENPQAVLNAFLPFFSRPLIKLAK